MNQMANEYKKKTKHKQQLRRGAPSFSLPSSPSLPCLSTSLRRTEYLWPCDGRVSDAMLPLQTHHEARHQQRPQSPRVSLAQVVSSIIVVCVAPTSPDFEGFPYYTTQQSLQSSSCHWLTWVRLSWSRSSLLPLLSPLEL